MPSEAGPCSAETAHYITGEALAVYAYENVFLSFNFARMTVAASAVIHLKAKTRYSPVSSEKGRLADGYSGIVVWRVES